MRRQITIGMQPVSEQNTIITSNQERDQKKGRGKGYFNPDKQPIDETTESFKNFIRRFRNSPHTRKAYTTWLRRFVEYCNLEEVVLRTGVVVGDNTDRLLFDNDTRKIQYLIKDFLDYQLEVKKLTPKTVQSYYDGIKRFYMKNGIQLDWDDLGDDIGTTNIKSTIDMPYTYEEIHKMLDKCDERKRVCVLLLASTGMRRGAVPELKVGDLKYIEEYGIYEITVYKGFDEEYKTYCSLECSQAIISYLQFRKRYGEKITPDSYLIRKQFNREGNPIGSDSVTISLPTDPPEKHKISTSTLETTLYQLIRDAGIRDHEDKKTKLGERHKNMAAHGYRKFFENKCLEAGIYPMYVEFLMGHDIRIAKHYYRPGSIEGKYSLLELYVDNAMPRLTISEESRQKQINRELELKMKERDEIVQQTLEELGILRKKVSKYDHMAAQIEELNRRLGL